MRGRVAEHARVAQGVRKAAALPVEGLGGEHVAVVLADEVALVHVGGDGALGLAARIRAGVGKIVVGVHVLKQMAALEVAHAARGARGVQPVGRLVGAAVERIVVRALIDAHAPQKDAGMVAVFQHHLAAVRHGLVLPGVAADVLPAGHFGEHQQPQLVASIQKRVALRVVARAHRVAAQRVPEIFRVQPLLAVGHGVALVRPALVPVQPAQRNALCVQVQPVRPEIHGAEAHAQRALVEHPVRQAAAARPDEPQRHRVQHGRVRAPGGDAAHGAGQRGRGRPLEAAHAGALAVRDLHAQQAACCVARDGGVDVEAAVRRTGPEQVVEADGLFDVEAHGPVDAAVGQIIDHKAEGRHVQRLAAVAADGHHVAPAVDEMRGQVGRKGRVAAAVLRDQRAVAENVRRVRHRAEAQQHPFAAPAVRRVEFPPVARHHLVGLLAAVVVGQHRHRVRQAHGLPARGRRAGVRRFHCLAEHGGKQPSFVPIARFHIRRVLLAADSGCMILEF